MTQHAAGLAVDRNDTERRYEGRQDGELVGFLAFRRDGNRVIFTHAETLPQHQGQGFASAITQAALDEVRADPGLVAVPSCPYVRDWLQRHPDYADLTTSRANG